MTETPRPKRPRSGQPRDRSRGPRRSGAPSNKSKGQSQPVTQNPSRSAWNAVKSFDPKKGRASDAFEIDALDHGNRAVANALRDGVLRHGVLIDHLISHGSTVKPSKMERAVLMAARIGVLQYLRGIPPHAAVSEGVELLPSNHRARGLVNAVLRRVTEMVKSRPLTNEEQASWSAWSGRAEHQLSSPKCIVLQNRWLIESDQAIFPAETEARMLALSGIPRWLSQSLHQTLDDGELHQVLMAATEPPAVWFRLTQRANDEAKKLIAELDPIWAEPLDDGTKLAAFRLQPDRVPQLLASEAFYSGQVTVQDLAAQIPVAISGAKPGWKCIDFCAAPGGKTAQLAERVGPGGNVVAVDVSQDRLKSVKQNVDRMRLSNTRGVVGDATTIALPDLGKYDLVLADVPCTNTGVMGRRVEVKIRLTDKDAADLKPIQLSILANAAKHLKPGGTLIHSTCSLLDSENGALVREFLEDQGGETSGWRMLDERLTLPKAGLHDGGYVAVLKKP